MSSAGGGGGGARALDGDAPAAPWLGGAATAAQLASAASATHLILFDVDGTLIQCSSRVPGANRVQEEAFSEGLLRAWGVEGGLRDVEHAGKTDRWILRELYELKRGAGAELPLPPAAAVDAAAAVMERHVGAAVASGAMAEGLQLLPGVAALLERLRASGRCVLGLVTGNLQAICWAKLGALGLGAGAGVFSCGGFGSDGEDRAVLIRLAARRAEAALGARCAALKVVHVGDTPRDVEAAFRAGAFCIGVPTGKFSARDLAAEGARLGAGADRLAVLPDGLADAGAVLRAVGLADLAAGAES
jgi:phosphoglycolate phosphatase